MAGEREVDLSQESQPADRPIDTKEDMGDSEAEILKQAVDRIERGWNFWQPIHRIAEDDVEFAYNDQWPQAAKQARANRPQLTLNMLPQFIHAVVGGVRRSKFNIQIAQVSGKNDPIIDRQTPDRPYSRSQVMEGLIRDIEQRSHAMQQYAQALQHTVEGGFGWLMVQTRPNIHDPFDIELTIEAVKDRWSVFMDPDSQMHDFSDADWCSHSVVVPLAEFKARWPEKVPADHSPPIGRERSSEGSYMSPQAEGVRVVDYWWKEPMERTAIELVKGEEGTPQERLVVFEDEVKDVLDELEEEGFQETNRKTEMSYKVMYMRFTYANILEKPEEWPSLMLPIVPVLGRKIHLRGGVQHFVGLTRYAQDAQRMVNYWMSAATEKMALVPRSPFIAAEAQIASHERDWQNMYQANKPVLIYNAIEDVPPPQRVQAAAFAQGEIQIVMSSRELLQDTLGTHDATVGRKTNEVSGVAIQERQEQSSNTTFEFVDNLGDSVVRVGEILVDMAPRCYSTNIPRRVVLPDDTSIYLDLNRTVVDKQTGKKFRVFSLDYARYSCRVSIGPSTKTQREEFVNLITEIGRSNPQGFSMIWDLMLENIDIPNMPALVDRVRRTLPPHLLSPEDQKRIPPPQPTPEQQLQAKQIEADMAKAEAEKIKAQADIQIAQMRAESDKARLDFEIARGMNREDADDAKAAEQGKDQLTEADVQRIVKKTVAEAVASRA